MSEHEKISVPEAIGFWQKNKSWLVPAIAAIMGILGGNADRAGEFIPEIKTPDAVVKMVEDHETRIKELEKKTCQCKVTPKTDDGVIKVE